MGVVVTNAMIGGMLAQYTGSLAELLGYDWRLAMQVIAGLGGAVFVLIALFVKDTPHERELRAGPDRSAG